MVASLLLEDETRLRTGKRLGLRRRAARGAQLLATMRRGEEQQVDRTEAAAAAATLATAAMPKADEETLPTE